MALSSTSRWVVIDGSNVAYRSFHAYPKELSHRGAPTNAIAGCANFLFNKALPPIADGARIVWAAESTKSFRASIDAEYKATRQSMPPELRSQMGPIRDLARAFGCCVVDVPGQEADDVIARIAQVEEGVVEILGEDKDLFQLVTDDGRVSLVKSNGQRVDAAFVREALDVEPWQVPDYLALCGDAADNIKGIRGIGPKSAAKLLKQFGTLETVLERGAQEGDVKPSMRAKIRDADPDTLLRYKRMTTLGAELGTGLLPTETYRPQPRPDVDFNHLIALSDRFGLNALKAKLLRHPLHLNG